MKSNQSYSNHTPAKNSSSDGAAIKGVLFDLDGTLVDTVPDLLLALNTSLQQAGSRLMTRDEISPFVTHGSLKMVQVATPILPFSEQVKIQQAMLAHYHHINGQHCQLFSGIYELLHYLQSKDIPMGIVTNKAARYTRPLLSKLSLDDKMLSVISGDSTAHNKPHPAPMLLAAQQIQCEPQHILYLGDAKGDLIAAQAAGMQGGVALWGYINRSIQEHGIEIDSPHLWPARFQFSHPTQITPIMASLFGS